MMFFTEDDLRHENQGMTGNSKSEVPLSILGNGEFGTVSRLDGDESFRSKMIALGLHPGKTTSVIRGCRRRPYIIRVDDSRLVLDWESLQKVYVQINSDLRINGRRNRRRCGWRWNG